MFATKHEIETHPSCSDSPSVKRLLRPLPAKSKEEPDRLPEMPRLPARESRVVCWSRSPNLSFLSLLFLRDGIRLDNRFPASAESRLSSTDFRRNLSRSLPVTPSEVVGRRLRPASGLSLFELLTRELLDPLLSPWFRRNLESVPRGEGAVRSVLGMLRCY